jgi:hypothetical protein
MTKSSKKTDKPLVCTIDRAEWARGDTGTAPALLNNFGNFCCLGFLGKKCGLSEESMEDVFMPYDLSDDLRNKYPSLSNSVWDNFAIINDDPKLSDFQREKQLRELAKKHGFRFRFTGEEK